MSHQTLRDVDRELLGRRQEEEPSGDCAFCGATELKRSVGYAGCVYCRRGGERGQPIGAESVPTCTTAEWIASKERAWKDRGGFSGFCKHHNVNEETYRKEALDENL